MVIAKGRARTKRTRQRNYDGKVANIVKAVCSITSARGVRRYAPVTSAAVVKNGDELLQTRRFRGETRFPRVPRSSGEAEEGSCVLARRYFRGIAVIIEEQRGLIPSARFFGNLMNGVSACERVSNSLSSSVRRGSRCALPSFSSVLGSSTRSPGAGSQLENRGLVLHAGSPSQSASRHAAAAETLTKRANRRNASETPNAITGVWSCRTVSSRGACAVACALRTMQDRLRICR